MYFFQKIFQMNDIGFTLFADKMEKLKRGRPLGSTESSKISQIKKMKEDKLLS